MMLATMGSLGLGKIAASGLGQQLKNAVVKSSLSYMKTLLCLTIFVLTSGCRMHKSYGNFTGGKTWFGDKNTMRLSSPTIDMQDLRTGPIELFLIGAPTAIDPLEFSIAGTTLGGSGKIKVQILTHPERRLVGTVIANVEGGKPFRSIIKREGGVHSSWIILVTEALPINHGTEFRLSYHFRERVYPADNLTTIRSTKLRAPRG
jgi:hypothetical protein